MNTIFCKLTKIGLQFSELLNIWYSSFGGLYSLKYYTHQPYRVLSYINETNWEVVAQTEHGFLGFPPLRCFVTRLPAKRHVLNFISTYFISLCMQWCRLGHHRESYLPTGKVNVVDLQHLTRPAGHTTRVLHSWRKDRGDHVVFNNEGENIFTKKSMAVIYSASWSKLTVTWCFLYFWNLSNSHSTTKVLRLILLLAKNQKPTVKIR